METLQTEERAVLLGQVVNKDPLNLPFFSTVVQAGFPSPAEDYIEKMLDLNDLLVKHPIATFFVRVMGDSMREAGIQSEDILVVDRSLEPAHGKIIVAYLNGEFTVKRLSIVGKQTSLVAENPFYPPLEISEYDDFQVWGVVTYIIHKAK